MKCISQERLKEIAAILKIGMLEKCLIESLVAECQEIDTLTVSKLRPMCDAPKNIPILSKYNGNERLLSVCLSADSTLPHYEGWLPIPIYKPEE